MARAPGTAGSERRPTGRSSVAAEPAWVDLGIAVVVVGGVLLRFVASSPLWLDEVLSVNIASAPFGDIAERLRHDGAPPLYYVMLRGWIEMFGSSDLAVRALSGALGVLSLPLVWLAGNRLAGREGAWTATVLLAASPFALRYATEARMYSLVILLTAAGYLVLQAFLDRPTTPRLAGLIAVTAAMVLTHYWALYLVGALLFVLALRSDRAGPVESPSVRFSSSWAMVGIATGLLLFLPWLPSLLYQLSHTGTPWAGRLGASTPVVALLSFGGTGTDASTWLGLALVVLALIGIFGRRLDRRVDESLVLLDLRGTSPGRNIGLLVLLTLVAATVAGAVAGGTFHPRYGSVLLVPFLLLVALGVCRIASPRLRRSMVAALAVLGMGIGVAGAGQARTQAGEIAGVLAARSRPGDLVVYCPDQLGPAMERRLHGLGWDRLLRQVTYPDLSPPTFVDWADYAERIDRSRPEKVAQRIHSRAAGFTVWLVWSTSYRGFGGKCGELNAHLNNVRPEWRNVLTANATGQAESANLTVYPPG